MIGATSPAVGSVENPGAASGPVPPAGSGVAPQAHGAWPPPCLAPNYHLYGFPGDRLLYSSSGKPRGVQTALQWSPDGSEVLFASGAQVYAAAADGSHLERLISVPETIYLDASRYATQPITAVATSPDGDRIAFAVCYEYAPGWTNPADPVVAQCRALQLGLVLIGDKRSCDELPVVVRDYEVGPLRLTRGYAFDEVLVWDRASQTTLRLAGGYAPAWSPDGTRLAFLSWYGEKLGVFVALADGRELQLVAHGEFTRPPRWSPDGRQLAVVEGRAHRATLYVLNVDGTGRQWLSDTRSDPAWSPDGSRIAFVRALTADGTVALYTIGPDGSGPRRITSFQRGQDPRDWWVQSVAWSPDGSMLLYGCGGICVVTRDGQPVELPAFAARYGYNAAWSPDGARIAILTVDGTWGDDRVLVTTAADGAEPQVLVIPRRRARPAGRWSSGRQRAGGRGRVFGREGGCIAGGQSRAGKRLRSAAAGPAGFRGECAGGPELESRTADRGVGRCGGGRDSATGGRVDVTCIPRQRPGFPRSYMG